MQAELTESIIYLGRSRGKAQCHLWRAVTSKSMSVCFDQHYGDIVYIQKIAFISSAEVHNFDECVFVKYTCNPTIRI